MERSPLCLVVIALVLVVFTYSATGRCLDYGHSCLGGHGKKRADPSLVVEQAEQDNVADDQEERPQWMEVSLRELFSRLITKAVRSYRQQKADSVRLHWPHRVPLGRRFDIRL